MSDHQGVPVRALPVAEGLLLRPFEEADLPALIEAHRDETLRHFTRRPVDDAESASRWLARQREGWAAGSRYSYAVLDAAVPDTAGAELLGNVALKCGPLPSVAEVGYWTAAPARGRGVAPRAVEVLTAWAFETFAASGLERIDLLHQVDNEASCRVAEKCGYRFEEVLSALPPDYPLDGHRHARKRLDAPQHRRPE
ncbi:GNAT family N-acetyltransferase [Kitasatospora sp. NPDC101183]|uniref:GNAT family N-acetyltransferase n=1 Tax=Kitasatospora sp. NPDC101183 TaxID=3364100 RepID=UPI0038176085